MNGELIKRIVRSFYARDDPRFSAAVRQLIGSERRQGHQRLATDLEKLMNNGGRTRRPSPSDHGDNGADPPRSRTEAVPLVDVRRSSKTLDDILLAPEPKSRIMRFLEEYGKRSALAEYGLRPKLKLLFHGPPGNGKTLCAEVIAGELDLPLFYVPLDTLIASYLGETAANLRKVFDHGTRELGVLFFDEFDAIGKTRDDRADGGELKRVINSFLQMLDNYEGRGPIIAATNYESLLDASLWRRFDDVILFPRATAAQLVQYFERRLRPFRVHGFSAEDAASWCNGCSFSDAARTVTEAIKTMVLREEHSLTADAFSDATQRYASLAKADRQPASPD
jgi:SpoVK/Ycf46/Vps4 family AAA+-type ATPase